MRGSDNQRLHLLTELGTQRLGPYCRARTVEDDRLDLIVDGDGTAWMAGIPRRGSAGKAAGDAVVMKLCPKCQTERELTEVLCQGIVNGVWLLMTDVPIGNPSAPYHRHANMC